MTIYSEVGFGTTINIYLPRHDTDDSSHGDAFEAGDPSYSGKGELVLVVEDDPRVRQLTLERLKVLNYRTLAAKNGSEAQALLRETPDIDVVFSDLVMPGGVSGYEVADLVQSEHPDVAILLTSGYAEDLVHSDKLSEHAVSLLRKPYRQSEAGETTARSAGRRASSRRRGGWVMCGLAASMT